jgi:hypothetical protein
MAAECAFILSSGKKCRCVATRNQRFCRHHGSAAAPRPRQPRRYSRLAHWRDLGRYVGLIPLEEIPFDAYSILQALLEDGPVGISDRVAGRLLRALLLRYGSVPFNPPGADAEPEPMPQSSPAVPPAAGPLDSAAALRRLTEILEQHAPLPHPDTASTAARSLF